MWGLSTKGTSVSLVLFFNGFGGKDYKLGDRPATSRSWDRVAQLAPTGPNTHL